MKKSGSFIAKSFSLILKPGTVATIHLTAQRAMYEKYCEQKQINGLEIAVIGIGCRFPGAANPEQLWNSLVEGKEQVTRFTDEELAATGIAKDLIKDPSFIKVKAVVDNADKFDAEFFNYRPNEAAHIEPEERLLYETVWEALEDAGCIPGEYPGSIGLYAGAFFNLYWPLQNILKNGDKARLDLNQFDDKDFICTRVSYRLNLRGPSVALQTACSTSLVAIHLACRSLLTGECQVAVAGGSSIKLPIKFGHFHLEGGVYSRTGHLRAFDANADGIVEGDGVGAVVLKRLEDAINDGDSIYAVIKGSSINNDGNTKVGYYSPSINGQLDVLEQCYQTAEIDPKTLSFIECHGTGTQLGDQIEVAALKQAFKKAPANICALGSSKNNYGHTAAAAGILSFIKAVLSIKHKTFPPHINYAEPHPKLELQNSPFYISPRPIDLSKRQVLRGAVSSFGIGGTNAHIVVEEFGTHPATSLPQPAHLLVFSAKSEPILKQVMQDFCRYLQENTHSSLDDAAYTLQTGRAKFECRAALVVNSREEAIQELSNKESPAVLSRRNALASRQVVFMFPGQGAHYANMGKDLYEAEPEFAKAFEACRKVLLELKCIDIYEALYGQSEASIHTIDASPLLTFSFEYALAKLLLSLGIRPVALIGHSIGEYVAACISEVFSLRDALKLVIIRGNLMKKVPPGKMINVPLSMDELLKQKPSCLDIAADHGPSCIVSGPIAKVEEFEWALKQNRIITQLLNIEKAGHSAMMDSILPEYLACFKDITIKKPQIPFVSNVTGTWIDDESVIDPKYWVSQLRNTVQFSKGLDTIFDLGKAILLEVGPGNSLSMLAHAKNPDKSRLEIIYTIKPEHQKGSDHKFFLKQVAKYWISGGVLDWKALHHGQFRRKVSLPTYPFDHKAYNSDVSFIFDTNKAGLLTQDARKAVNQWFYQPVWRVSSLAPLDWASLTNEKYLIFANKGSSLDLLIQDLRDKGAAVIRVAYGDEFHAEEQQVTIDPQNKEHYLLLANYLGDLPIKITKVIHGWLLGKTELLPGLDSLNSSKYLGFYSVVHFINAYNEVNTLLALTNGLSDLRGMSCTFPEKSLIHGAIKVISKEYSHVRCKSVDIPGKDVDAKEVRDAALYEMALQDSHQIVSYLRGQRYVEEFVPLTFEKQIPTDLRLRDGGTYIITGGFGGIGLTIAEFIASKVQANIILFGRKVPPEHQITSLQAIKANAQAVQLWQADVSNESEMEKLFAKAREHFGKIDGVVHCAGAFDGNMLFENTEEMTEKVLGAKVNGTLILDRLIQDEADFFLLCSSLSSHLATIGQLNYAAASIFLDYFAKYKMSHSNTYTLSINWDAWKEVGGAVQTIQDLSKKMQPKEIKDVAISHPVLASCLSQSPSQIVFEGLLENSNWIVADHMVLGKPTMPGVGYIELATAAFRAYSEGSSFELTEVYLLKPLQVMAKQALRIVFSKMGSGYSFSILGAIPETDLWEEHAKGSICTIDTPKERKPLSIEELISGCPRDETSHFIKKLKEDGPTKFGDQWQSSIKGYWRGEGHAVIELKIADHYLKTVDEYKLHPALFDHSMSILAEGKAYVPFLYEKIQIYGDLPPHLFAKITALEDDGKVITYTVKIYDTSGRLLVEVDNYTLLLLEDTASQVNTTTDQVLGKPFSSYAVLQEAEDLASSILADAITCEEGKEVFARALNAEYANLIVSTKNFNKRVEENQQEAVVVDEALLDKPKSSRPEMSVQYIEPKTANEIKLAKVWQDLLGIDKVGLNDSFFDLGATSLQIIQAASLIKKALSVTVSIVNIYTYPTTRELVTHFFGSEEALSETENDTENQVSKKRLLDRRNKLLEV